MNINLHIDRLILDDVGIEPHQINALKSSVESGLKRQVISRGIVSILNSHHRRIVNGGSISIGNTRKPDNIGQLISNSIYRGIGK